MRYRTGIIILAIGSVISTASQLLIRWGGAYSHAAVAADWSDELWGARWWLAGLMASWITGLAWAWSIRTTPLSFAVPFYNGLIYFQTVLLSLLILRERLSVREMLGAGIILMGILLIVRGSTERQARLECPTAVAERVA